MATHPSRLAKMRRAPARSHPVAPLTLFVVATLTVLLWFRAVPAMYTSIAGLIGDRTITATVVTCETGTAPCTVKLGTHESPSTYDDPGLFAAAPGSTVTVMEKKGRIVQAGLPALATAALLVSLAVCFTRFTMGCWRRVLESAPIMPDDIDELENAEPLDHRHA